MNRMRTLMLGTRHGMTRAAAVERASRILVRGGLVAIPTETVYGLAANAFDEKAVAAIFRAKGRPADNPLIVHVASAGQAFDLAQIVPRRAEDLARAFWPGPLTLVLRKNASVPDGVTAGLATVAIRVPAHPLTRTLIARSGLALAAPSGNRSGRPSPTTAEAAYAEMRGRIAAVLDGGPSRVGIESTVVDVTRAAAVILRPGAITPAQIEEVIGGPVRLARPHATRPASPGMKYRHYAPETPLVLIRSGRNDQRAALARRIARAHARGSRVAVLGPARFRDLGADAFFSLGEGTPVEFARLMYRGLQELDAQGADVLLCPGIEEDGIGLAVMNRLRKAAARIV